MGIYFENGPEFWMMLFLGAFFTFLISVWLTSLLFKANLPLLGLPFLAGIWTILLSVRSFDALTLNERGLFMLNEVYRLGGNNLLQFYEFIQYPPIPDFWIVFLKSLGAIFFQYNVLSGIFIAAGILIYSRIAFSLSLLGFTTGYYFYQFIGGGTAELYYSFIGFNFILASISLGGFFVVPSFRSYGLVVILTPVMAMLVSALNYLFKDLQIPLYSLPFNFLILLMIYVLRLNFTGKGIQLVQQQAFQPEKNLYRHLNEQTRFAHHVAISLHPPFWGEWVVSQDDHGKITHLGEWRHAWDFVVKDDKALTYKPPGTQLTDYYAYNLPVLSPAAGTVVEIMDGVEDNPVGGVELQKNWGNTVVLWHGNLLYSKLSHLKTGSIPLKVGQTVQKGDTLGVCGNSGRSPEPHIHFQVQATPYIGSRTIQYPLAYYLENKNKEWTFHSFGYPKEGSTIRSINKSRLLQLAFNWPIGKVWLWEFKDNKGHASMYRWEVLCDEWGNRYLWCPRTKSAAWFNLNDSCFWFYHFSGDKNSLLYHFYRATYKVPFSVEKEIQFVEEFPLHLICNNLTRYVQDFLSPFGLFMKADYGYLPSKTDDPHHPTKITLQTQTTGRLFNKLFYKSNYHIEVGTKGIYRISISELNGEAVCIED